MSAPHSEAKKPAHPEKAPKKRGWINRLKNSIESIKLPHIELKARPFVEKLKWYTAGGASLAWLHSSILFPSLAIATGAGFAINKFILKDDHHGSSAGH